MGAVHRRNRSRRVCQKEPNLLAHAIETARREWGTYIENPVPLGTRPKANRAREVRLSPGEKAKLAAATGSAGYRRGSRCRQPCGGASWSTCDGSMSMAPKRTPVMPTTKNGEPQRGGSGNKHVQIVSVVGPGGKYAEPAGCNVQIARRDRSDIPKQRRRIECQRFPLNGARRCAI
jgi:hypothetical protein